MSYSIKEEFNKSKERYIEFKKKNKRLPTTTEWNKLAKEYNLLSSVSMRNIGNIRFKKYIDKK